MNNWYKLSQLIPNQKEYIIENGILFDENGDEVFSIKELIKFKVPIFLNPKQANAFLDTLESVAKKSFGRVSEQFDIHNLKYKDSKKDKQEALNQENLKRQQRYKSNII